MYVLEPPVACDAAHSASSATTAPLQPQIAFPHTPSPSPSPTPCRLHCQRLYQGQPGSLHAHVLLVEGHWRYYPPHAQALRPRCVRTHVLRLEVEGVVGVSPFLIGTIILEMPNLSPTYCTTHVAHRDQLGDTGRVPRWHRDNGTFCRCRWPSTAHARTHPL